MANQHMLTKFFSQPHVRTLGFFSGMFTNPRSLATVYLVRKHCLLLLNFIALILLCHLSSGAKTSGVVPSNN